jgi:chaperonin GroES
MWFQPRAIFPANGCEGAIPFYPPAWEVLLLMAQPACEGESLSSANENGLYAIGGFRMNIRPLHDRIVVKRIEASDGTTGGLFIPDSAKEKPQEGIVVAVSRGKFLDNGNLRAVDVRVGDHILYGKYTGSEIKLAGDEYLIVREDEVLGVLEGAERPATKVA